MTLLKWLLFLCLLSIGSYAHSQDNLDNSHAAKSESASAEQFTLKVLPVLRSKCFSCHGEDPHDLKGDLDLTSLAGIATGGESGSPALTAGQPNESLLIEAIRWDGLEMPPKENDRLSTEQIADFEHWILHGAEWPDEETIEKIRKANWKRSDANVEDGEMVKTSGGLADDWTYRRYKTDDLWAIQPIRRPKRPKTGYNVDSFINAKLADANLSPAPHATSRELIRRASYDLTGLPPTPEEIAEFESAHEANPKLAWSNLIDQLLSSKHYGERWGQHWLDVVRYADTAGFSNDFEMSNAWRFRDYVIRSFNNDLPFNEFIVQQIAGDELWAESQTKGIDHGLSKSEARIATGLLRMGPWEHTGMSRIKVSRQEFVDDMVNSIGQAFLSTALRCCKCHDHKFDPIPTRDYYRFYAALSTTQPAEMEADFLDVENTGLFEEQEKHCQTLLDFAETKTTELNEKREAAAKQWYRDQGIEDQYQPWKVRGKRDFVGEKPPRNIGLTPQEEGRLKVREQDVRIWKRRLERFQPLAQGVYNGPVKEQNSIELRPRKIKAQDSPEENYIFAGGSVFSPDQAVTPGVLSCVGVPTSTRKLNDAYSLPQSFENRRLELARWIADPDNGLSTRSIVNRIWHYHFGRGIAANPNNFGATGAKPTHPELLDWLTLYFVENGWSIKTLHRVIMQSDVYMRSTQHPDHASIAKSDPSNALLSHFQPRRLTAEELRDTMLAASGELNLEIGGLPVRPEINQEVALSPRMIQFSISPAYQPEPTAKDRNRRSIYAYRIRGLHNPLLEVLDQPNPNESCELRDSASTAPQVFALMNGDSVTKRSFAMAHRLRKERVDVSDQISLGFELATGRILPADLSRKLESHYQKMLAYHQSNQPEPVVYPTSITRSLVEENTGEKFQYEELLDAYRNYEPDLHAVDLPAETRALADVCLLFFNSNQMMYVY